MIILYDGNEVVEKIDDGIPDMEFDMTVPFMARQRIKEISFVNVGTAPELMSLFNEAYDKLIDFYPKIIRELGETEVTSTSRRAVLIIDEVPRLIKEKNLGTARSPNGSEDVREALVDRDSQYVLFQKRVACLKAMKEYVLLLMKDMEMAYTGVKKILDGQQRQVLPMIHPGGSTDTEYSDDYEVGGTSTASSPIMVDNNVRVETTTKFKGFGQAKY